MFKRKYSAINNRRILFVLGGLRIGGYEILSVNIANKLSNCLSYKVGILSLSFDNELTDRLDPDIELYFVRRRFKFDMTIVYRIYKVLRAFNPSIVLTCAYFEYTLTRLASMLLFKKPRFILVFHHTEPCDRKEYIWDNIYSKFIKLFNDTYVAIHTSQIEFYHQRYGIPKHRFNLIHNGIDTEYFKPNSNHIKDMGHKNQLRIVHVANLKPLKDQWILFKALVEFNKFYKNWHLRIVGKDQTNIRQEYEKFLSLCSIRDKVEFLGYVHDVRSILNESDVFVLTSKTEALPLSVIEAISMGLPCIVTDVGGNSDIIEHGKNGFLVKPGDYKSIAEYLKWFVMHPKEMNKMKENARTKAVKEFDFNKMVKKYDALFKALCINEQNQSYIK